MRNAQADIPLGRSIFDRTANRAVGEGFYPSRAGRTNKFAQQMATTQNPRRGRCPHRPGRMQLQNCTNYRRKRKTFCRGGRLCPPDGQSQICCNVSSKRTCAVRGDVGIAPYKRCADSHWCVRVRRCVPPGGQGRPPLRVHTIPHWCIQFCNAAPRGRGRTPPLRKIIPLHYSLLLLTYPAPALAVRRNETATRKYAQKRTIKTGRNAENPKTAFF